MLQSHIRHPQKQADLLKKFARCAAQTEANAKFDETIELAINLGTDPKRGDHMVRGVVSLPHGTGKTVRVAVFAQGEAADAARAAGAFQGICVYHATGIRVSGS